MLNLGILKVDNATDEVDTIVQDVVSLDAGMLAAYEMNDLVSEYTANLQQVSEIDAVAAELSEFVTKMETMEFTPEILSIVGEQLFVVAPSIRSEHVDKDTVLAECRVSLEGATKTVVDMIKKIIAQIAEYVKKLLSNNAKVIAAIEARKAELEGTTLDGSVMILGYDADTFKGLARTALANVRWVTDMTKQYLETYSEDDAAKVLDTYVKELGQLGFEVKDGKVVDKVGMLKKDRKSIADLGFTAADCIAEINAVVAALKKSTELAAVNKEAGKALSDAAKSDKGNSAVIDGARALFGTLIGRLTKLSSDLGQQQLVLLKAFKAEEVAKEDAAEEPAEETVVSEEQVQTEEPAPAEEPTDDK